MAAPAIVHFSDAVYHYIKMPIDRIITGLCSIIVKHDTDDYTGDDPDDAFEEYYDNWGVAETESITGTADGGDNTTVITTAGTHGWGNDTVVWIDDTAHYNGAWAISSVGGTVFTIQTPYVSPGGVEDNGDVYAADSGTVPIAAQWSAPFDGDKPDVDPQRTGYKLRLADQDVFLFSVTASVHLNAAVETTGTTYPTEGYATNSGTWFEAITHPYCISCVRSTLLSRHNNAYGHPDSFYKHGISTLDLSARTDESPVGIYGHEDNDTPIKTSSLMNNGIYSDEDDNWDHDLETEGKNSFFTPVYDIKFEAQHALSLTANLPLDPPEDPPLPVLYQVSNHEVDFYNLAIKIKLYSFDKGGDRDLSTNPGTDTTGGTQKTFFRNRTNVFWQPFGETAELQLNKSEYT